MNNTMKILQNHRTFREFDPQFSLPEEEINAILKSAQQAPSWMNGQHYSIIRITDKHLRAEIGKLQPKNPQIVSASEFWVFIADLHRMTVASLAYHGNGQALESVETLITAVTDVSLAAENALIAAESLGYGCCFIGSIRSNAQELISLLNLPEHTYPIFGLCIGKPSVEMRLKPRLPREGIIFENTYQTEQKDILASYEQTMTDFGEAREVFPWREKFARYYSRENADQDLELLQQQKILPKK